MKKIILFATAVLSVSLASADLVNGGFDDYTLTGSLASKTSISTLSPVSWTEGLPASGGRIDLEDDVSQGRGGITGAQEGSYFIAMDNNDGSGLFVYQSFTTVASQQYALSFWTAPANDSVNLNLGIDVFDGAVTVGTGDGDLVDQTLNVVYTTANNGWTKTTYNFTATSTSATLRFIDQGLVTDATSSAGGDQLIDSVSITAIPEPATLGLITAFGGGILFIRRRLMV
jgi:hypothetical protein